MQLRPSPQFFLPLPVGQLFPDKAESLFSEIISCPVGLCKKPHQVQALIIHLLFLSHLSICLQLLRLFSLQGWPQQTAVDLTLEVPVKKINQHTWSKLGGRAFLLPSHIKPSLWCSSLQKWCSCIWGFFWVFFVNTQHFHCLLRTRNCFMLDLLFIAVRFQELHPISAPLRLRAQPCLCGSPAEPRKK